VIWYALLAGLVAGTAATALVYVDAARRGLPARSRIRWAVAVALASVGGFAVADILDGALLRLYWQVTGAPAVVPSPWTLGTAVLLVGLGASAAAVLAYGLGSRVGPFRAV
jgi:hypothetical protein